MSYHVFISYRREGGSLMARLLYERLKLDGCEPFLDIEQMHSGVFDEQLYDRIAEADDFILILSENALDRCSDEKDWMRLEIQRALLLKKNIIPFMMKNFVYPKTLPDSISSIPLHHSISESMEYFDASYARLRSMMHFQPAEHRAPVSEPSSKETKNKETNNKETKKVSRAVLKKSALDSVPRNEVRAIVFTDTLADMGKNAVDVSESDSAPVMMWNQIAADGSPALYIGAEGRISLPEDSSFLFSHFTLLNRIDFNNACDTSRVRSMKGMFSSCYHLSALDLSCFDTSSVEDMCYMFDSRSASPHLNTSVKGMFEMLFSSFSSLTQLDLSSFDTSRVISMQGMFRGCSALTHLDLSHFDTSSVEDMCCMFDSCSSLTQLDLSSFDTSRVISMQGMFRGCSALTQLDLSRFDTSSVENMFGMFFGCTSLTQLDLSHFDTSSVKDMIEMFSSCSSLTQLDLSSFDTSRVISMQGMFRGCSALTKLNLSHFATAYVGDMNFMFRGCSALTELDLSSLDTRSVNTMHHMFTDCRSLKKLDISSFDTRSVITMDGMFSGCTALTELDLTSFNTKSVRSMEAMFQGCFLLTKLSVSEAFVICFKHSAMLDGCATDHATVYRAPVVRPIIPSLWRRLFNWNNIFNMLGLVDDDQ